MKFNVDNPGVGPREIDIAVVRTARKKSISIQVREGAVRVLAPCHMIERSIAKLLAKNRGWIERKLSEHRALTPYVPKSYANGEAFLYLGQHYWLNFAPGVSKVRLDGKQLSVDAGKEGDPRSLIEEWYITEATRHLNEATKRFAEALKVEVSSITVKNYKSRWGSCSVNGDIRYNWRIVMAPLDVIEYLSAHEVSHRMHHNHSKQYWTCVESLVPQYKQRRDWLKEYGHTLRID